MGMRVWRWCRGCVLRVQGRGGCAAEVVMPAAMGSVVCDAPSVTSGQREKVSVREGDNETEPVVAVNGRATRIARRRLSSE